MQRSRSPVRSRRPAATWRASGLAVLDARVDAVARRERGEVDALLDEAQAHHERLEERRCGRAGRSLHSSASRPRAMRAA